MNVAELRSKYLPAKLRVLFIAEAAPDSTKRFFYYDKVMEKDWLYLYLMRALYGDAPTEMLRAKKAAMLDRFKADGFYLVDAIDDPVTSKMPSSKRTAMIHANADKKLAEIKALLNERGNEGTKIVLIKTTVFNGLYDRLVQHGLPVENTSPIYFPSNSRQPKFLEQIRLVVNNLGPPAAG